MTFEQLTRIILESSAEDWVKAFNPLGFQFLAEASTYSDGVERHRLQSFDVDEVATFRRDISIQMVDFAGPGDNRPFFEPWLQKFADNSTSRRWIHVLWNGHTVFRQFVLSVDGARCTLPIPIAQTLDVPQELSTFVRLVHEIFGCDSSYTQYFQMAGFKIVPGRWPV